MSYVPQIDWAQVGENLYQLAIAYLIALPIGWNRERRESSAGLRTFPLVAVAACAYMLTGMVVLEGSEAWGRVMVGIVTGMGFIGGGAILKSDHRVRGTATAASLWSTGAIGMAVAWHRYEIALVVGLVAFLTLRFGESAKERIDGTRPSDGDAAERAGRKRSEGPEDDGPESE